MSSRSIGLKQQKNIIEDSEQKCTDENINLFNLPMFH